MNSKPAINTWGVRSFATFMVPRCILGSIAITTILTVTHAFLERTPGPLWRIFVDQLLSSGLSFLLLLVGISALMCFSKFFLFEGTERDRESKSKYSSALVAAGFVGLLLRPTITKWIGNDGFVGPYGITNIASLASSFVFGSCLIIGLVSAVIRPLSAANINLASNIAITSSILVWITPIFFILRPRDTVGWVLWIAFALVWLLVAAVLVSVCYQSIKAGSSNAKGRISVGTVSIYENNGLPGISWVQEIGTTATKASEHSRLGLNLWAFVVALAGVFGLVTSGAEDMFFYAIVAGFFGLFGLRGVHATYANGGIQYSGLSEQERKDETIPITKREDCEAWVQLKDGEPVFHLARGDRLAGPLAVVAQMPLRELGSFEISTHSAWLRSPTEIDQRRDWGVIINETASSGVVVIAEWVHAPRWLTELRGMLSKSFDGVERERILAAAEEAKRGAAKRSPVAPDPAQPASAADDKPKRRF
jgi:hypothetical protein